MSTTTKYIGAQPCEDFRPVSAAEVTRVIAANRQFSSMRAARVACMRILRDGELLGDGTGYVIRLRKLPE
jgi:hypothetical protein